MSKPISSTNNDQYQLIAETLNGKSRLAYDQKSQKFVSLTREEAKQGDKNGYITELSQLKDKIVALVETKGIEDTQLHALDAAFEKRAKRNDWSFYSERRTASKQLREIKKKVDGLTQAQKAKINGESKLASTPGPKGPHSQEVTTPVDKALQKLPFLLKEMVSTEESFVKQMQLLNALRQDEDFIDLLKDPLVGGRQLSDDEIVALFEPYPFALKGAQSMAIGLKKVANTCAKSPQAAKQAYEDLINKTYPAYAKNLSLAVRSRKIATKADIRSKLSAVEKVYRNYHESLLKQTDDLTSLMLEAVQRPPRHGLFAKDISPEAHQVVQRENAKINQLL
jgi:hypothetical protein